MSIIGARSLLCVSLVLKGGEVVTVKLIDLAGVPQFFVTPYSYASFVGFALAFCVYILLRRLALTR
jgi:cytosine/uracil/thiamine/allantoin permease